jgi:hypothetical protein
MNTDNEIQSLHAETLALNWIIAQVLRRIAQSDQKLADAICRGFNDAASDIENLAIRAGKAASPDHLVKALRIVEELRSVTVGDKNKPRNIV